LPAHALDAFEIAHRHCIVRDIPTPNFFEGMPLGNGDVGVCVVVRPDALGLYLGKNDCWDIRMSEDQQVVPFRELLKMWQRASDEAKQQGKPEMTFLEDNIDFLRDYTQKTTSYLKPWPRTWPCGTVWVRWDPRWVQPGVHVLDPATGLFTLDLKCVNLAGASRTAKLSCFVDWASGLVSVSTDTPVAFSLVSYYPRIDEGHRSSGEGGPKVAPAPENHGKGTFTNALPYPDLVTKTGQLFAEFSCFQYFPAIGPTDTLSDPPRSDKDRNFSLHARVAGNWSAEADDTEPADKRTKISLASKDEQQLRIDIKLTTPRDILLDRLERDAASAGKRNPWIVIAQDRAYGEPELDTPSYARKEIERLADLPLDRLRLDSDSHWHDFWSHSAVQLEDKELERIWYHNQYFLACCLRAGKTAPGLFGNWVTDDLGIAWHGDYHLDYNMQQAFWGVFSSNHAEQHLPYVEMCQNLLAMCEKYAREKYELPGACFPLVAVPVPSQSIFVPTPPWGYQVSNTPWVVQSLWWQYLYTQDVDYLRHVYPMLRAAAQFIAAYVKKGDDGKYHVIPTVSPENWGFTVDYRLNKDCILDLALIQFLLDAVAEGSTVLKTDSDERLSWKEIRENLAPYPKAEGPHGEVWLDVRNAPTEYVYNLPVTLAPVFPGEQVGIGRNDDQLELARRTARTIRLEGDNDLVGQPLARARLGILDFDWFKREVRYCSLPNGVANDRVRQVAGRHNDTTDFDFMMRLGFWTENFALPAVLNECMMQSYTGTIHLFPNANNLGPASFQSLRAAGAFLLSASYDGRAVTRLSLLSEKGNTVRIAKPWTSKSINVTRVRDKQAVRVHAEGEICVFDSEPGETYQIEPQE
jgi:hypothetical protein